MKEPEVPKTLKLFFTVHFAVDILFALPLMFLPETTLLFLGWQTVDPFATRLAAAALLGIGIESLLAWNAPAPAFLGMLNLKIIWSSAAMLGILLSLIAGIPPKPLTGWLLFSVFAGFNLLWVYWRVMLPKQVL